MSETRTVVVLVTLIVTYAFLVGLVSASGIFIYDRAYEEFNVPDYFNAEEGETVKWLQEHNVTYGGTLFWYDFELNSTGLPIFNIRWYTHMGKSVTMTYMNIMVFKYWLFLSQQIYFTGYNTSSSSVFITLDDLDDNWFPTDNCSRFWCKSNDSPRVRLWVRDSNLTRNNMTSAWSDDSLLISIGFGFEDLAQKFSFWSIMNNVLTFQSLDVEQNWLNYMVSFPIYAGIVTIAYIMFTKIIPFT